MWSGIAIERSETTDELAPRTSRTRLEPGGAVTIVWPAPAPRTSTLAPGFEYVDPVVVGALNVPGPISTRSAATSLSAASSAAATVGLAVPPAVSQAASPTQ